MSGLTVTQIREGLKDKDSLISFLKRDLGFNTNPVFYEATDLSIAPYLAKRLSSWWLLSHYPGKPPFQIHFAQLGELTFSYCTSIIRSFHNHHAGAFLFIFTQDYTYVLFMAAEWSLERMPTPGKTTWPFLPKPYPRFLLVNRQNPTQSDIYTLSDLAVHPTATGPSGIHARVIQALKSAERFEPVPEWFLPYWYRLRDPAQLEEALSDANELLAQAEDYLMGCLASESLRKLDEAPAYLDAVMQLDDVDDLLGEEERHRMQLTLRKLGDVEDFFEDDERDEGMMALQDALFLIYHVRNTL